MFELILNYLTNYGWLFVLAFNIIYIIVKTFILCYKNRKVDVKMLYETLKSIPKIMEQAELLFPSGRGQNKLDYTCNVIKVLLNETNPNSQLLKYDWDKIVQNIFDCTSVINKDKEDNNNEKI